MSRLRGWVVAAFALLVAVLFAVVGQRDKAREKTKQARVALQVSEASREIDNTARKAQEQARQKAAETQREAEERPADKRPSGHFRR